MSADHSEPLSSSVHRWSKAATEIWRGHSPTFDDYLNDLDLRHRIEVQLRDASDAKKLFEHPAVRTELLMADDQFRAATAEQTECVWGEKNAREENWSSEREWYYYRLPLRRPAYW